MADIDLTQYNGTPVFPTTADVGTNADPYLTPTDGKIITATSNAVCGCSSKYCLSALIASVVTQVERFVSIGQLPSSRTLRARKSIPRFTTA